MNQFNLDAYLKTLSPIELEAFTTLAMKQAQTHKPKNSYVADKVNSTYWWEIEMNFDQKVRSIVGYSKFEGFNEGKNKDDVLCKRIEMLSKHNYLAKSNCITIYRRMGPICNRELDEIVIVITPSNWDYREWTTDRASVTVKNFLSNLRGRLELGIAPKVHLIPKSK